MGSDHAMADHANPDAPNPSYGEGQRDSAREEQPIKQIDWDSDRNENPNCDKAKNPAHMQAHRKPLSRSSSVSLVNAQGGLETIVLALLSVANGHTKRIAISVQPWTKDKAQQNTRS